MSDDVQLDRVGDPNTSGSELANIAGQRPDLHAAIAGHPNAYPELLNWLAATGNPVVIAAVEARAAQPYPFSNNVPPYATQPPGPVALGAQQPPVKKKTGLIIGLVAAGVVIVVILGVVVLGGLLFGSSFVTTATSSATGGDVSSSSSAPSNGSSAKSVPSGSSETNGSSGSTTVSSEFCAAVKDVTEIASQIDANDVSSLASIIAAYQKMTDLAPAANRPAYQAYVDVLAAVAAGDAQALANAPSDLYSNFSSALYADLMACSK